MNEVERWQELGQQLRVDSVRCSSKAGSGHPTSSMSAADLMAVLVDKYLRYDFGEPKRPENDRLVFSKGHASPLLYAIYKATGAITDEELMTYRTFESMLEGHPTPRIPWVDVATGSLGQGLPIGIGMGLAGKYLDRLPFRVWVLCGDSEFAEGSIWEALEHGAHYSLDNVTAILDVNRLGQRGETMVGWDLEVYVERARSFGWHAIAIDGHDVEEVDRAYAEAIATTGRPTVDRRAHDQGQGRQGGREQERLPRQAVGRPGASDRRARRHPQPARRRRQAGRGRSTPLPRAGARASPLRGGGRGRDAEGIRRGTGGARSSPRRRRRARRRGRELDLLRDLREGLSGPILRDVHRRAGDGRRRGRAPGARLEAVRVHLRRVRLPRLRLRPHGRDQPRRASRCRGSHAGVSIGEDGPSQMALEDIASLRAVHGSVVLHPCDANQTAKLVAAMADTDGISVSPHAPAGDEGDLRAGRGVRDRRESRAPVVRGRRHRARRRPGSPFGRRSRPPRRSQARGSRHG